MLSFNDALALAERYAGQEPRRVGSEYRTYCPAHETPGASEPSLDIREGKNGEALVQCRSKQCDYAAILAGWGYQPEKRPQRPVRARYTYRDAAGRELATKIRFDDDRSPKMLWDRKLNGQKMPLYRLDSIEAGQPVAVVEGERDVETLISMGFPAVCSPHGAAERNPGEKWRTEYTRALAESGCPIIVFQDNDEPGRAFAEYVARELAAAGRSGKLIPPFPGPKGFDVSDWIAAGHTREELAAIIDAAPVFTLEAPAVAKVDGAGLLDRMRVFVRRFVVINDDQSVLLALWALHTFALDAFDVTPYLAILSAEKRSGKSRLLEVLGLLVRAAWHAIQPSEAVLFRMIDSAHPTLLLDETDALFSANPNDRQEAVRALLNSGNRRGVTVPRCANHGKELVHFDTFCAKALAGIGKLPETVADRSFEVRMRRKKRAETAERFRVRDVKDAAEGIRADAEAWTAANLARLAAARPSLPDELGDRAQDGAEPLLAIADLAGGSWPADARRALVALAGEKEPDELGPGMELLQDCRAILDTLRRVDGFIRSELLLRELLDREGGRWKTFLHGGREPLNAVALAKMLRPYDVRTRQVKDGGANVRAYPVSAFQDAFERYLSPVVEEEPVAICPLPPATPLQPAREAGPAVAGNPLPNPLPSAVAGQTSPGALHSVAGAVAGKVLPPNPHSQRAVAGQRVVAGTRASGFSEEAV